MEPNEFIAKWRNSTLTERSALMTRIAAGKALPFEPLVPNAKTIAAMKAAWHGKLHPARSAADLLAKLNADH